MRAILSVATLTLIAVLSLPFAAAGQAADPWLGTWKLDLTRSKRPGTPVKSQILKLNPWRTGRKSTPSKPLRRTVKRGLGTGRQI